MYVISYLRVRDRKPCQVVVKGKGRSIQEAIDSFSRSFTNTEDCPDIQDITAKPLTLELFTLLNPDEWVWVEFGG